MQNDPLLQILILLAASVCVVAGVRRLALPAILGYLAVGMLLGPHALALASDNGTTRLLADFGGYGALFTEMLSASAFLHENPSESPFTRRRDCEGPVFYQFRISSG